MRLLTTLCFTIFITFVASEELTTAIPVELEAKCKMPVDVGTGDGEIEERFFFDEPTQSCKAFNYTGAGGNENNFFSELECLNDCFIGVVNDHTKDQAEEDIVILSQNATQPLIDAAVEEWPCSKPKHNGDGKGAQQRFYYDDAYKTCFAFKYTGSGGNNNRFESHSECMSTCGLADGSVCSGPILSLEPLDKMAFECKDGVCPKGSHCARGMMVECCHKGQYDAVAAAFAETCPDGSAAGGVHTEYFQATFAKSCDDLICGKGEKCVQTSKDFAKCCGAGRRLADEVAVHVRLEDCDATEKKAIAKCEEFLSKIDIAQKLDSKSASKSMISGVANLLKEFNSACSLFDEYKTCMSLVTKNAGCLDPTFAVKEQILNFVCQENVKTAMVGNEGACVEKIADSKKVKDCEDGMPDKDESICETLDYTLNCTMPEITECGSNTLSFITRVVKTIKDAEDCNGSGSGSDSGGNVSAETTPEASETTVTITTEVQTAYTGPQNEPRKSRRGLRNRHRPSKPKPTSSASNDCPSHIPTETTSICLPLLTSRSVKHALSGTPGSFVFSEIVAQNIRPFCTQGKTYRQCVERIYTSIDACTEKLKDDAFYSFIVAIYDHLCEDSKQLDFLINAGCLNEVTSKSSTQRCLLRNSFGDGRTLCKTYQQFDNCLLDTIAETCRDAEVKYFEELFDLLTVRQHLCSKSTVAAVKRPPPDEDSGDYSESDDEEEEAPKTQRRPSTHRKLPGLSSDCNLRRQLALIRGSSFIPQCENDGRYSLMQCDRKSGTCFCVDTDTGEVTPGSVTGPGKPLPLCGLQSLFTCERLPEKLFCEIDVTLSQKTERWYRRGNRCVKYLYDYCPSQAHIAPIPLRSLTDCKRFCLPSH